MGIRFDEVTVGMTLYRPVKVRAVAGRRRPPLAYERIQVLGKDEFGCQVAIGNNVRGHLRRDAMQRLNRNPPKPRRASPAPRAVAGLGRRAH